MYDILQLNDMLVPELLDIAEQLKIPNAKKSDKQDLIYKILDRQAVIASAGKGTTTDDKGRRKRIVKTSTANSTEEAVVESNGQEEEQPREARKRPEMNKQEPKKEMKRQPEKPTEKPAPAKRGRKKADAEQPQEKATQPALDLQIESDLSISAEA